MKKTVLTLCAVLAGCAAEPVPYHSGNEIPRGPGLLSGERGEFSLKTGGSSAAPRDATEEKDYQEWREERKRRQETPAK
jgi:hypothetical protein